MGEQWAVREATCSAVVHVSMWPWELVGYAGVAPRCLEVGWSWSK